MKEYWWCATCVFALSACAWTPQQREAAGRGVEAGVAELGQAVGQAATSLETGGWAAAGLVLIVGVVKGITKGYKVASQAAKKARVEVIAEGVKRANGKGKR